MSTEFKAIEDVLSSFGSKLIEKARANLNKKEKRANGTLFNEMSYDIEKTPNGVKFKMDFGSADDYWLFVDQGVEGAGGFKGSGKKRGQGSPFRFGRKQPPLSAILPWIKLKNLRGRIQKDWKNNKGAGRFISDKSFAFIVARSIKQKGIERTRFITKPFDDMIDDLKNDLSLAMVDEANSIIQIKEQPELEINLSK